MMKRTKSNEPAKVDEIEALRRAIIRASEEGWEWRGVSTEERTRLRPVVLAQANAAAARLRAEHVARIGAKP